MIMIISGCVVLLCAVRAIVFLIGSLLCWFVSLLVSLVLIVYCC